MNQKRKRSPDGIDHKVIALRLMPSELAEAERVAKKLHSSKSAMARDAFLLGLPLLKEQEDRSTMTNRHLKHATALPIFTNGNQADPEVRLLFCNRLISLADLDGYLRRAEFIAAYSTGGTEEARRAEAKALADTGIVPTDYIVYCAKMADARSSSADFGSNPEIV